MSTVEELVKSLGPTPTEEQIEAMALLAHKQKSATHDKSLDSFRVDAFRAAFRAVAEPLTWSDVADQWTKEIYEAHPTRSDSHEEYGSAMAMVGHRHSKGALVSLVNWLLVARKREVAAALATSASIERVARDLITWAKASGHTAGAVFEAQATLSRITRSGG